MTINQIRKAITTACGNVGKSEYAKDVLYGYQRWSGSDLRGKASTFGARYARMRQRAEIALSKVGGFLVPLHTGKLIAAFGDKSTGELQIVSSGSIYRATEFGGGRWVKKEFLDTIQDNDAPEQTEADFANAVVQHNAASPAA